MKDIKILGSGCAKCKKLEELVNQAIKELNLQAKVEKISDINEIYKFNVMLTPALIVNNEIKVSGRLPNLEEIKKILS